MLNALQKRKLESAEANDEEGTQ